ncbi:hypothetical protein N7476_011582 [Penicillium atrosanguineum]|uniref:Uncharacterized protein n=1 Tax=Penicillium atrosanguineum TaxID=1132637 RepID=A0A9W9PMW7_9EURO|nr:hypothetical protein N7476_011582 [Penicillium atrosanguineum]
MKEFFTLDEIEAGKEEEREYTPDHFELDPVSDYEEQETQEEDEDKAEKELPQPNNDSDEVDLPQLESTQARRASERSRKRPRQEDDE